MENVNLTRLYLRALEMCGEYLRENPPGDLDKILAAPDNMIGVLAGGGARDPRGHEWTLYWINQAYKELKTKEESV